MTLDEIAIHSETDKSSLGHSYCQYYDMFFSSFRDKEIKILEIGIDKGNSLKMWERYFKYGEIHGIDIREGYDYLKESGRVFTHLLDQSSKEQLTDFGNNYGQYFDIIIDDGSHEAEHQVLTFETLFPALKSGGYYCCEDLLCSFDRDRWGKTKNAYDRILQTVVEVNVSGKINAGWICANKQQQKDILPNLNYFEKNVEWVFNSMGLAIIKKI